MKKINICLGLLSPGLLSCLPHVWLLIGTSFASLTRNYHIIYNILDRIQDDLSCWSYVLHFINYQIVYRIHVHVSSYIYINYHIVYKIRDRYLIHKIIFNALDQYSASYWKSSTKNEWAFREERFVNKR